MLRKHIEIFSFLYKRSYFYARKYFLLHSKTLLWRISKFDRDRANRFIGYMFIKFTVRAIFHTRDSTNHYLKSYLLTLSNDVHPLIRSFRSLSGSLSATSFPLSLVSPSTRERFIPVELFMRF